MNQAFTLALDAMGGDRAPEIVVDGAEIARERFPELHWLFVGDEARIKPLLDRHGKLAAVSTILHTEEFITNETKPSAALRNGRGTSMGLAIEAVADKRAAGVVSAGNTGALMALSMLSLKTLPGIERPAIAAIMPTLNGESVMLDLGANIRCDADNLVQFAVMGEVFARTTLGIERPMVGLLNVGEESLKGHDALRQAAAILGASSELAINFRGFVEGNDIGAGTVDVVVTDGFTGNVALKTAEGTAQLVVALMRRIFRSSFMGRLGYLLARGTLERFRERLDPRNHNGAPFVGLNGIVVKSHGGTDALGFASAISVAVDMISYGFNDKISEELHRIDVSGIASDSAATAAGKDGGGIVAAF